MTVVSPGHNRVSAGIALCALALLVAVQPIRAQEYRIMQALFYDHDLDGPSGSRNFGNYRSGECGADNEDQYTYDMVKRTLAVDTLTDGTVWKRPVKNNDLTMDCNSSHLDQWFDQSVAKSFSCRKLYFVKSGETSSGSTIWRFHDNQFFPIDDAPNAEVYGNSKLNSLYGGKQSSPDGQPHNYNWTMTINATFTYRGGEHFYFRGDDDLWVFINNKLALDLGGIHSPVLEGEVRVDEVATQLILEKGETYDVDIFFAERKGAGSTVLIETTMDLMPVDLKGIGIRDEEGNTVADNTVVEGTAQFCADPMWDEPGEEWCRNHEPPQLAGGSIEVNWYLNGVQQGTGPSECVTVDPSDPLFANGKQVTLRAEHPEGYTSEVTLTGRPNVFADSVFLVGNGRMEQIAVKFDGDPSQLPANWNVTFSTGGFVGGVGGSDTPSRRDGYTLYFELPEAEKGPVGQSYVDAGVATFTKQESGKSQETASVPVVDRMSPIIVSAELEGGAGGAVLTVTVSEELDNVAELYENHVAFKRQDGTPYEVGLGTWTSTRGSTNQDYTITIPVLASPMPKLSDSISLNEGNQFIKDKAGNAPQSWYVEIQGEVTVRPTAMRLRGTGRLDTVILDLDRPAQLLSGVEAYEVRFDFHGSRTIDATDNPTLSENSLTYVYPAGSTPQFATYSDPGKTGTLYHPYTEKPAESYTFTIHDEMGPVVDGNTAPTFTPVQNAGESHTLTFRVSEELAAGGNLLVNQLELHRGGTGTSYTLNPGEVTISREGTQNYRLLFTLNATVLPQPGDSISLDPTVLDLSNNPAPYYPIPIVGDSIEPNSVIDAAYYDSNVDGQIDSVVLQFARDLVYLPDTVVLRNAGATHRVDMARDDIGFGADRKTVIISLDSASNRMKRGVTYVSDGWARLGAQDFQGISGETEYAVKDAAAPVINSAGYRPGPRGGADSTLHDTLTVAFSEKVHLVNGPNADTDMPFTISHGDMTITFTVKHLAGDGTNGITFEVQAISDGVEYPSTGGRDRIWIRTDNRIRDLGGLVQTDERNRRVPLRVEPPPVNVTIAATTPFTPGQTPIHQSVLEAAPNLGITHGMVVVVKPSEVPLSSEDFWIRGWITIYDVVGNVIMPRTSMEVGEDNSLYFGWDGTNVHRRTVGAGTYLAIVDVEDKLNGATTKRIVLGVQR